MSTNPFIIPESELPPGLPVAAPAPVQPAIRPSEQIVVIDQQTGAARPPTALVALRSPDTVDPTLAKPVVPVPSSTTTITESARLLFTAIAPRNVLFSRGEIVVRLIDENGRVSARRLGDVAAQSFFEGFVSFQKPKQIGANWWLEDAVISRPVASQYLQSDECRRLLPKLTGIVNCPVLVQHGNQIHQVDNGYDPVTGLFVSNQATVPEVSLEEAVHRLSGLLDEFVFKTPADRSRALMSFITPALRFGGFMNGNVPMEVAEADRSQSGKSYRQQVVAAVYHEKVAILTKRTGGVGSMEETFQRHLVGGRAFIQFDNVRGPLNCQLLESFLTANGTFPTRTPYKEQLEVDPAKHVLFISSNNFQSTEDLANRSSIVRILKRPGHNFKQYDGVDLATHVFTHHVDYLACVFRIVRHWFDEGKPRTVDTRHDFREWCQVGDWIIRNVFRTAPLMDGHEEAKQRVANPNLGFFRNLAVQLDEAGRLNCQLTATNIAEFCEEHEVEIPNLRPEREDDANARRIQVGILLKSVLGTGEQREWEGYRLSVEEQRMQTVNENWQPVRLYRVERVEAEQD